jgi:ATP dependent DNA ligase C terminal region
MIDIGKLSFRGEFGIANGSAVTDFVLAGVAQEFDQSVMRKMLSISPNDLAAKLTEGGSVLVCTKVDGEGTFVYFDQSKTGHEQLFAFSVGGRVRVGFKALNELGSKLKSAGVQSALLRCELSLAVQATRQAGLAQTEANTVRDGVSEVIRVSFSGTETEIERFRLVVLDVVMLDRKDLRANQHDFNTTLQWMQKVVGSDKSRAVYCMHAEVVAEKDLRASFDRLVQAGEEGIVVRRLNRNDIWKIKPHRTIDAVVIGYVEGEFEDKYGVNSMLTALCFDLAKHSAQTGLEGDQQGVMQSFVRVGGGLSDELRVSLLDRLRALKVQEPIAMTDSSGRVIHFIRPELMIEIHGEDLISQEQGKAVRSQRLRWDASQSQYEFLGLAPCPRLSFARFAKFREDKRWQDGGARISQVGKSSESTSQAATAASSAPAKVIRREVYTKAEMLRKLVIVHQPAASFPYMIYWTDFSAKRAEPLKVSIEIAADEQRANLLAQRLVAENIVKGWEKFAP